MIDVLLLALLAFAAAALPHAVTGNLKGAALVGIPFAVVVALLALVGVRPAIAYDNGALISYLCFLAIASGALGFFGERIAPICVAVCGALAIAVVCFFATSPMLHAERYRTILDVTERPYDGKIELLAQERVQLVDARRAAIRAGEILGADKGLGSQYGLGRFDLMVVSGRPTWVAPLVNRRTLATFFGEPTPGYVSVDATNDRDARLVTTHKISVHAPDTSFFNAVDRTLWFSGFATSSLTDYTFELDDSGRPYWVVTTYERTVGIGGEKATGVIVVDAETGRIESYDIAHAPTWIDLIQPDWIVNEALEDNGKYVRGWRNAAFSGEDVIVPTQGGLSIVHMADGTSRFYTGLRTQTSQNGGTSGFALVNTRTGQTDVYLTQGISERTAEQVLEGAYQADRYDATSPRLYLVDGKPTLVSLITDASGNPKGVGMVAQETRAIFGTGSTLDEARRNYVAKWNSQGAVGSLTDKAASEHATFTVSRIGFETADKTTNALIAVYSGPFNGQVRLFVVPVSRFREAAVTREGDTVHIRYMRTGHPEAVALDFENLSAFPMPK